MLRLGDDATTVELTWDTGERRAAIRFHGARFKYRDPHDPLYEADNIVEYIVSMEGNGFSAEAVLISIDAAGFGLPRVIEGVAGDFRGWEGTQTWENADHDLAVSATRTSRGYVSLDWRLTPSIYDK
ncbi:hypothetical protein SAMN04489844_1622 [Nocardioides exalbidus]|uniref:Uncharacterized protein n=1 Tax=Nocardioides exalbidus TaxID=402596 RepID=A0A1H4PII4_9ACTN|nr:DUF6228 family protein [Nocardioides exalbidus]SEC07246.1 hypothetical protein SAMN04489844_1622 [Nocardioides exalbidus]